MLKRHSAPSLLLTGREKTKNCKGIELSQRFE